MPEFNGQEFIYKTLRDETKELLLKHDTLIPVFLPEKQQAYLIHIQANQTRATIYVDISYNE